MKKAGTKMKLCADCKTPAACQGKGMCAGAAKKGGKKR